MKNFILLFSSLFVLKFCAAQELSGHRWQDRVILLFADGPGQPDLQRQLALLTENAAEVTERDLVRYRIYPQGDLSPAGEAQTFNRARALRSEYNAPDASFLFILIGKDGTEKLRSREVVSPDALFARIDRMPMRRAEMRRKNGDG